MNKKQLLTYLENVPDEAKISIDSVDTHDAMSVQLYQVDSTGETVVRITDDPNWMYDQGAEFVKGDILTFGVQADEEYINGFIEAKKDN